MNDELVNQIEAAHIASRLTYGSPRITAELKAGGIVCSENRVARLMSENNIRAKCKRKFKRTTVSDPKRKPAPNLLQGNFNIPARNQAWVSDITYVYTRQGWLYLATVMDLFSRKIVGWSMSRRMQKELVLNAFGNAVNRRNPDRGLIFHSDRGSQYSSDDLYKLLDDKKFKQSMSGKGNCYDNAVAESFFATLKTELMKGTVFDDRDQARLAIFDYIDVFYNRTRRHSKLGYLSPTEFEKITRHS